MELVILDRGVERHVLIERVRGGYRVEVDGVSHEVDQARAGGRLRSLLIEGRQHEVSVLSDRNGRYRVVGTAGEEVLEVRDPLTHLAQAGADAAVTGVKAVAAYMPGRVVALLVSEGDLVEAGQGVLVLEAMKMENEIRSEVAGVVSQILVEPGQSVDGGDPLFEINDD